MRRVLLPLTLAILGFIAGAPGEAQIEVRGQIVQPDGSPAVGVEVRLLRQTGSYEFYRLLAEGRFFPEPTDKGTTRNDGSFELRAPEAGMWHLHVAPKGYRPMEFNFWPLLESRRVPELELTPETTVKVTVNDPAGNPVAGAHVRAKAPPTEDRRRMAREFWRPAYRQAITDDRGSARIGRAPDEAVDIYAYAVGFHWTETASVRTRSIALWLEEAAPRTLRIETPQGEPIAGALVRLGERRWPLGFSDDDGQIQAFPAEGDEPQILVLAEDGRRLSERLNPEALPIDGPRRLTLEARALYSGRLLDSDSQAAIGGGFVWISGRPVDSVRTDATGGFDIAMEGGSKRWIWGAARGYLNTAAQLEPGAQAGPTLRLPPTVEVRGVVVDATDQPVAGAEVTAAVDLGSGRGRRFWQAASWLTPALSDAQGRFTVTRLDPEVGYTLKAAKPGFAPTDLALPSPRAVGPSGVRLVLEAGRTIVGTVVDQGGLPVAGAKLEVTKSISSSNPQRYYMQRALGNVKPEEAFSDPDGRFVVWDLPAGLFDLKATAAGHAPAELATLELPESATETDVGEIVLPPGFAIEGRVTSTDGAALEGAQVFATGRAEANRFMVSYPEDQTAPAALTDASGFFTVADRAEGEKVDLAVKLAGYAEGTLTAVSAPTYQPVSIRLELASRVRGVVVDESGRAVADARVGVQVTVHTAMMSSSRTGGSAVTTSDGSFLIDGVDPGELELSVRAEGFVQTTIGSLRVEPGEDLDGVRVELKRGATISGRITGPGGRPVGEAQVMSMETQPGFGRSFQGATVADGEGRYQLDGISPGNRTIIVRHDEYKQVSRTLEVEAGDNPLDIVLERGLTVSGRVVDSTGQPVPTADLSLQSSSINFMGNPQDVSDEAGSFAIEGLSEGTYVLRAHKEGFAAATLENLEVGPAGITGVEVRLEPGAAIVGRIIGLDPADYASIQVHAVKLPRGYSTGRVNRDGTYRVGELAPGSYSVQGTVASSGLTAQGHATVVSGGTDTVLDLEFEIGLTLTGVVLRSAVPMGGAQISATGLDVAAQSSGLTDSEGRFQLQGLDPGRYRLAVRNYVSGLNHQEEIELQVDRDVTVRVEAAELSGFVRDADDSQPVAGAAVQLEPLESVSSSRDYGFQATATTDSDGYFKFKEASAGSYRVLAQKDGYAPTETSATLLADGIQDNLEILLSRTDGLRVYVTLPSGQPAQTFVATIFDTAGNRITYGAYSSDSDGGTVMSLAPGTWDLLVVAGNTAMSEVRVTVPSEPVAIALQPEARLVVRVPELEDDLALGTVKIFDSSGRPYRGSQWIRTVDEWPLAKGRSTVNGLAPGSWSVHATTPDGRSWQGQAQLAAGDNAELVLH